MLSTWERTLDIFNNPNDIQKCIKKNWDNAITHQIDGKVKVKKEKGKYSDGRARIKGVYQCSFYDKWMVVVTVKGKKIMLYYGDSYENAVSIKRAHDDNQIN